MHTSPLSPFLNPNEFVLMFAPNGQIIHVWGSKLTGFTPQEITGKTFLYFLIEQEKQRIIHVFCKLRSGMFPSRDTNFWKTKHNGFQLVEWQNTCELNANGDVVLIIARGKFLRNFVFRDLSFFMTSTTMKHLSKKGTRYLFDFPVDTTKHPKERVLQACSNCRKGIH